MNLIEKTKALIINPNKNISFVFEMDKLKLSFLFPFIYVLIVGLNKYLGAVGLKYEPYFLGEITASSIYLIVMIFIFCLIYSFIVWFISLLLKGIANVAMVFNLMMYSLIPLIIGTLIILLVKLAVLSNETLTNHLELISKVIYYFQSLFVLWALIIFVLGVKYLNQFSLVKSIISSIGLFIVFIGIAIYQQLN